MKSKINVSIVQKSALALVGLIIITFFVNFIANKATELRKKRESEDVKPFADIDLSKYLTSDGNIQEGLSLDDIGNFFDEIGNGISSAINGIGQTITMVGNIIDIMMQIITGIPFLVEGIFNHVVCGSEQIVGGLSYGVPVFGVLLTCAWEKWSQFFDGTCTIYYIIDIIWGIFYGLFIEFPILIIYALTGLDLGPIINLIFEIAILPLDMLIFAMSGYHITQWPDSVIKKCFRCSGTINVNGQDMTYHKTFAWWGSLLNCSSAQIGQGIDKIFTSFVPGPKWWSWLNQDHLTGSDTNPPFVGPWQNYPPFPQNL